VSLQKESGLLKNKQKTATYRRTSSSSGTIITTSTLNIWEHWEVVIIWKSFIIYILKV